MPTPQRPDLAARLQAAVAEGDALQARRLADQLVHRRGVAALEDLLTGPLAQRQGEQAVAWLRELVFGTPALAAPSPAPTVSPAPSARLQVVPPLRELPTSPAPAPAALASLRAWLPDASDLPQAS